ncbi:MAG: 4Fe-4S dicluster domain-containing protein [Dehalococcoidia bacterium]|nr:4Fe-4S dicluster domain-containing protein [Dehalococcoidia bacterium]MDH4292411.1 4Fe-4S dicluster domain-containing protein [Dehalococcoidia bacterium]
MKDTGKANLRSKLESLAKDMGSTYFGIADLAPATRRISEQSGEFLTQFPRAVSHGFVLADGILNTLVHHKNIAALSNYWYYVYQIVNPRIDSISLLLAQSLGRAGFQAFPVPSSQTVDRTKLTGTFSHKLAAHLAGMGWIGKSALLITPEHGPRVRWGTVLTDAPLEAGTPVDEMCRDCNSCVKGCPAHAFTGQAFDKPRPRSEIFAAEACDHYLSKRETFHRACGICVYICPFGRNK